MCVDRRNWNCDQLQFAAVGDGRELDDGVQGHLQVGQRI